MNSVFRGVAVWVVGAAVLRATVVPAEVCPPVAAADVRRSLDEAVVWLERGQQPDGRFRYGYFRDRDEVSRDYNTVRHAGVVSALYAARRVEAGDRGLAYVRANLVDHGDWQAFAPDGEYASVGANALVVAALIARRDATGDQRHDALVRRLARFLVAQTRSDGSVLKYAHPATGRPVPGVFGKWSTGEAFWALALAHRVFPAEGFGRAAHRVARYLALRRDEVEGHPVRLPDHWAAYGLAELARADLLDAVEVAYARRLAGYFGAMVRLESQRGGVIARAVRGGTNSGAGMGTIGEGAAALWRLAGDDPRLGDVADDLGERVECLAGILVERQVDAREAASSARPTLVRGAWFDEGYTQMDDQQHAISALLGALDVFQADR